MGISLYSPWPTTEQQLLLDAALRDGPRAVEAFAEWRASVDLEAELGWSSVRLLPLAYSNLVGQHCEHPLMGRLKGVYRRVWLETNQLFHRTAPLVKRLRDAGVEVMLLKGAPIALTCYRNLAHRAMSDLDIGVRENQLDAAHRVLEDAGWRTSTPPNRTSRVCHAAIYEHADGATIDLHWHLLKDAPCDEANDEFWAAAQPLEFMGTMVRQLHPGHALLNAILHGLRANPEPPIRWITDSLAILSEDGDRIDWLDLTSFAQRHRVLHRFSRGVLYLEREQAAPIPAEVVRALEKVRPGLLERLENTVIFRTFPHRESRSIGWEWANFLLYCRAATTRNPVHFVANFLVYRFQVDRLRDILPKLARGFRRRYPPSRVTA